MDQCRVMAAGLHSSIISVDLDPSWEVRQGGKLRKSVGWLDDGICETSSANHDSSLLLDDEKAQSLEHILKICAGAEIGYPTNSIASNVK